MHLRRIAAFLLGAWLAGSLIVLIACFGNLASVDEAMENSDADAQRILSHVGNESARMFLHSLVAAENARLLSGWELAEAPLGILAVVMLFLERPTRFLVVLPVVMLLLVAFEHLLITPEIAWLSQTLAFARAGTALAEHGRLDNMHRIYGFVEAAKLLTGVALAVLLFVMRSGRRSRRLSAISAADLLERRAG
jgi:cellobiose-specific phosphotransferase system component IIC